MKRFRPLLVVLLFVTPAFAQQAEVDWAMNATIIEACSCPMFCPCFFNDRPAKHHDHASGQMKQFCEGSIAFRVNRGHFGDTKLDGVEFWMAGDLGDRLSDGLEWGVITFEPSATPQQRQGVGAILAHVYPFPVKQMSFGKDAAITWSADKDRAVALLDDGKAGEIRLRRFQGNTDDPVVIRNLRYVGAPRNDGFVLMPNEIHAWRGERAYQWRDSNGFVITIDINSKDVAPKPAG